MYCPAKYANIAIKDIIIKHNMGCVNIFNEYATLGQKGISKFLAILKLIVIQKVLTGPIKIARRVRTYLE